MSMNPIAKVALTKLAKELIKTWKSDPQFSEIWNTASVSEDVVTDVLKFMNMVGFLESDQVEDVAGVIKNIVRFQKRLGVGVDGVIGKQTDEGITKKGRTCAEDSSPGKELSENSDAKIFNDAMGDLPHILFYHVEEELAKMVIQPGKSSLELIAFSWQLWQQYADIVVRIVESKEDANVVIKLDSIDRSGNTLGIAHIGGPAISQQLTLRLDRDEPWDVSLFLGTVTHELGHILGLKHSSTQSQLMNPFLNLTERILEPREEDIKRIKDMWGAATAPGQAAVRPTDSFPGKKIVDDIFRELGGLG